MESIHSYQEESDNNSTAGGGANKKRSSGRPSNAVVWENVKLEQVPNDDGTGTLCQQTCVHCGKVNRAHKPQTTWWATHLVDRGPKGCVNCPTAVRNAILENTKSQQVRDAAMGSTGGSVAATGQRRRGVAAFAAAVPNNVGFVKRGLSKLLEDNILVEEVADGNISQTCRHCKKNRTCKQTLATVWSKHFVDISSKGCPQAPWYIRRAIAAESSSAEVKRLAESQGWMGPRNGGPSNRNGDEQAVQSEAWGQKQSPRLPKRAKTSGGDTCSEPPDGCCQAQADSISMKIMEFLTTCGHSMLLVQSPVFLDLLRALNLAYVDRYLTNSDIFVQHWLPKLHTSIEKQIGNMWKEQHQKQQSLGTLGLWGGDKHKCFDSDGGPTGKVLTETLQENKIVFWDTIKASSEEGVTASGLAQALAEHMTEMAGDEAKIEDTYGAVVVTSNAAMNVQAGAILQERFPKMFINQCRLQALKYLRDEIFRIPEIARICSEAQFVAHFIRDHPCSSKTFAGLVHEKGGSMPSPWSSRDFNEAKSLLTSLCGGANHQINAECFAALVRDSRWVASSAQTIDPQLTQHFESLVSDAETFSRFQALSQLLGPLTAFAKHLERPEVRASWIYPLFQALLLDVKLWCTNDDVKLAFKREDTFEQLLCSVNRFWKGESTGDRPGLYTPQLLLATLLDPTTCPDSDNLPEDWDNDSDEVMKRFYSGKELLDANAELMTAIDRQGKFGREVERYQEALKTAVGTKARENHYLNVQQTVEKQLPSVDMKPQLVWKLSLKSSLPLLQPIARRVLVMGTSSVDASWANKLHHALHLNAFNPNNRSNVLMLLYSHLNLRAIQRGTNSDNETGTNSFEEFLGQAILESPETSTPGTETGYQADLCCESDECSCCC